MSNKKLWKLVMELVTEKQLEFLALTNAGFDFPVEGGTKSGAEERLKNMLGIPKYHLSGKYCTKCGGYLWWDGTCTECSEEDTEQTVAQELRHISEKLAGGGDASETVDELWELANELDPDGADDLLSYIEDCDDSS